jgi:hypothetical protein
MAVFYLLQHELPILNVASRPSFIIEQALSFESKLNLKLFLALIFDFFEKTFTLGDWFAFHHVSDLFISKFWDLSLLENNCVKIELIIYLDRALWMFNVVSQTEIAQFRLDMFKGNYKVIISVSFSLIRFLVISFQTPVDILNCSGDSHALFCFSSVLNGLGAAAKTDG